MSVALAALTLAGAASCARGPLAMGTRDAAADADASETLDAAPSDAADASRPEAPIAPGRDALAEASPADALDDAPLDAAADASGDLATDAAPAVCPAGAPPLDVCRCGCCGAQTARSACYYPTLGQTREAIPIPMPSAAECALDGCDEGTRHVCCADPGVQARSGVVCARDTSTASGPRFTITRRDADVCTTLELGSAEPWLTMISAPAGYANVDARRGPCDGSSTGKRAIGALGEVTAAGTTTVPRYDVHVALFFDDGTGVADALRIDADDVVVAAACTGGSCPVCGLSCAFDATYRFTTVGGLAPFRDMTALAPPASFTYVRGPEAVSTPERSCAPPFPACGGPSIDVSDVMTAFSDPDVQAAFTRSMTAAVVPFFGEDQRGSDGPAFQILRDDGGNFLVGAACPATPTTSSRSCTEIPPGVGRLVSVLNALNRQQLAADPSCAFALP